MRGAWINPAPGGKKQDKQSFVWRESASRPPQGVSDFALSKLLTDHRGNTRGKRAKRLFRRCPAGLARYLLLLLSAVMARLPFALRSRFLPLPPFIAGTMSRFTQAGH
jgi:hypothetical protein